MGVRLTETKPEIRMATQMVTANSRNKRPRMPPMKSSGMKTAASDKVIEIMVNQISATRRGRPPAGFAVFDVTHDVLEHHDGVVHHEADERISAIIDRLSRL